ncbi:MAG: type II toxin-antitoxin system RelE/ParE family toxin [Acidobacteria bacterium]|nr:type II toxin-antitoxin system RelE/ParE family toxin [Acidobacteriota bacterium]
MKYSVIKRPGAADDIEECFFHIAKDNREIGSAFLVAVEDGLEELAEFPLLGKAIELRYKEVGDVRMWHVKGFDNYLIFYTVQGNNIVVTRVLHGSRDIDDLLS